MMSEKFALKWNDFQNNAAKAFSQLRNKEDYYDVTLVSDDFRTFQAHKIVLSACSPYFDKILKKSKGSSKDLVLCLDNIEGNQLNNILDYIYNGEAQILENNLDNFLNKAQRFQLEGLTRIDSSPKDQEHIETFEQQLVSPKVDFDHENETKIVVAPRSSMRSTVNVKTVASETIGDLDQHIETMYTRNEDSFFICHECDRSFKNRSHVREHVESHIEGLSFPCHSCNFIARSRLISRKHKCKI